MQRLAALEFKQTPDDFKYESVEDFKEKTQGFLEYLLKSRKENYGDAEELPTMPIIVSAVFEDMSGVETMIFPQSREEKNVSLEGIKQMIQKYHAKKKILCVIMSIEAWFSKVDTTENIPFRKELTDEQLDRKVELKFKNNEVEKLTKIIVDYQTPDVTAEGTLTTKSELVVYDLFQDFLLVLDEENTTTLNSEEISPRSKRNPAMRMFDPLQENISPVKVESLSNFSVPSALKYLQAVHTYLK